MTVTLSRASLSTLLGESPTEGKWAVIAHEHVKDRPHRLWLGILLDLRRQAVRAGYEDAPPPNRLLELCDRIAAQQRRKRSPYWSFR
jgi:hypothetical protein